LKKRIRKKGGKDRKRNVGKENRLNRKKYRENMQKREGKLKRIEKGRRKRKD